MANEFPKLSEVFKIGTEVTYDEAIEKVFLPQDNAVKSIPSISPIETVTLTGNKIVPTAFLVQIQIVENLSNELHFIDYTNLRDGAILQLRILDNNNPIVIKNGISGVGSIMTADGNDIELNDYRTIVQLQLEGTLWRQVGGIQAQADWNQVDSKKPDFIKNKPTNLLDSTRITNCITEIPQDIKLELNNGALTLKAGSKVYVPNGVGKFDEVVIDKDHTTTDVYNRKIALFFNAAGLQTYDLSECYSGGTAPTGGDIYKKWYDTTNNVIKTTDTGGNTWYVESNSLPLAIATSNTSGVTSIDQVFNGFGYIGSTVFALPGVKGLMPNGKNEDGSLKNDVFEIKSVQVVPRTNDNKYYMILGNPEGAYNPNSLSTNFSVRENYATDIYGYKYDEYRNMFVGIGSNNIGTQIYMVIVGSFEVYRGLIRFFNSKQVFKAVDSNYTISIKYWD